VAFIQHLDPYSGIKDKLSFLTLIFVISVMCQEWLDDPKTETGLKSKRLTKVCGRKTEQDNKHRLTVRGKRHKNVYRDQLQTREHSKTIKKTRKEQKKKKKQV